MWLGISPMPSSQKARQAVIGLIEKTGDGPVFDLGSGWGNLIIPLARKYPERKIVGYELSLIPWSVSLILKHTLKLNNLQLYRKNFLKADLSDASVCVCYLYPKGMQRLAEKISAGEMAPQFLISNNFALPDHQPAETLQLTDFYRSPVYLYRFVHP